MLREKDIIAERKDDTIREIIRTGVLAARWLPLPEEFHSGDEMGFDLAGTEVRATVVFDQYVVTVKMTSPVGSQSCKEVYYRQQTFFRRNPPGASLFVDGKEGGAATKKCIVTARELLIGLYSDWVILQSKKEAIHRKLADFSEFARLFMEKETQRMAALKERLLVLSRNSGELKRRFKNGEMPQKEYVEKRRPIHEEIVTLMYESHPVDPFRSRFAEELNDCQFTLDKQSLIKSI